MPRSATPPAGLLGPGGGSSEREEANALSRTEYLTAATEEGRRAITEVMEHSYADEIDRVPPEWTIARLVDGVPVSYIQIDPHRYMEATHGDLRYAFLMNVATREDRRREGHFRAIMQYAFSGLCKAGIATLVTHGRYPLYRPLGFDVFTHHSGVFATPEQIERQLGAGSALHGRELLTVWEHRGIQHDLLVITEVRAQTPAQCVAALQAAAALAREQGKGRILFEQPPAPSYGSRYPIYRSPETPIMALARTCGAQVCVQGADPEGGVVPDADWIKILDASLFLRQALEPVLETAAREGRRHGWPPGTVRFVTEVGTVTVESSGGQVRLAAESEMQVPTLRWPSAALGRLVTGYQSADVLCAIHGTVRASTPRGAGEETAEVLLLLNALFPTCWRFSRNESWVFLT